MPDHRPTCDLTQQQVEALAQINSEAFELCKWFNARRDVAMASKLIPIVHQLTRLLIEIE
jgi:hypothetical protein